jgi:hypothetical protein
MSLNGSHCEFRVDMLFSPQLLRSALPDAVRFRLHMG